MCWNDAISKQQVFLSWIIIIPLLLGVKHIPYIQTGQLGPSFLCIEMSLRVLIFRFNSLNNAHPTNFFFVSYRCERWFFFLPFRSFDSNYCYNFIFSIALTLLLSITHFIWPHEPHKIFILQITSVYHLSFINYGKHLEKCQWLKMLSIKTAAKMFFFFFSFSSSFYSEGGNRKANHFDIQMKFKVFQFMETDPSQRKAKKTKKKPQLH